MPCSGQCNKPKLILLHYLLQIGQEAERMECKVGQTSDRVCLHISIQDTGLPCQFYNWVMGWIKTNNLYGKVIQPCIVVMKQRCFANRESMMWHSLTISCSDLLMGGYVSIDIYADKLISDDLLGIAHPIRLNGAY